MSTGSDGVNWTLFTGGNFGRNYTHSYFGTHEFTPRLTAWGEIQPSPHRRIFFHNNPGSNYTMVWWGWMVTNFTGPMYFAQVTDDDFDLWIHPTDYNRPDTEGATRVINGNNWRPWFYGSYDVTEGTVYHTKMYMGEGGGGDDSVFYWNTTGPASASGFGHTGGDKRDVWPGTTGTMENFTYLDGTVEDTGKSGNSSWPTSGIPGLSDMTALPSAGDDPTDGDFALWFTTREKAEAYVASLSAGGGGGGGGVSVNASPLTSIDRNYNSNWVISVDKWDSYRSIGYQGNLHVAPIQAASVIAGGGGFDGSFNVTDASFRTQGDASSNWFSSSHPAQMAFNNDISFVGGQYFKVENVSAYQNGSIVSDSENSAVKLDFLFPSPRTATEYKILPPNETNNYNADYMPNRWCIYGSKSETIDSSLPSTEANGYFLLDSRADANPWSAHDASLISVSGGKKYIIANPGLYRQYRMSILQNSGNSAGNINIGELIYYEGGVGPLVGGGALDGRSDLSGGLAFHGDVSGVIGHSDGSSVIKIFDGSDNSLYKSPIGTFENYDLSSGKEFAVKFELPSKKKILKYDIKNTNIKSWTLRGCDNSAIYDRTDSNTYELLHGVSDFVDSSKSFIVSNPKDYTYYVLDISSTNDSSYAELGELIYYDTGSYPSAGAGSLDGSSGDVGGLLIHGDVKGVGGQSDWAALSGTLIDTNDAFISNSGVFSNNSLTSGSEFSVKFEFPSKKYISTYRIWSQIDGSMNSPSDWYLHGCDVSSLYDRADESTYNVLDVRTGENSWPVTSASSIDDLSGYNEYTIIDPGNYSYYVLDVSASNNASLCSIGELAYYESERVDVTTVRDSQPYENHQLAINMGASEETSDWEVGEIIVFNKKLTSEEEEKVVNYLENTFYGSDGFESVGNNSTLRLTRSNLRLPEVYSAMDPSSRAIEYFNQSDYNRIVNMNLSSINYDDISSIPIKTSDLRNRVLSTDASFTTITGVSKGYTPSSIVKLSDFRGATSGGGGGGIIGGVETIYGNYKVNSFINVGTSTFTVTDSITVDMLIVGGGAGGYPGGSSAWEGGGGGAGELIFIKDLIMSAGVYTIIVGAGGGGVSGGSTSSGVNGNITQLTGEGLNNNNGYIANGGGTGTRGGGTAQNGGSGGGSGHGTSGGSKVGKARSGTSGISHVLDSGESGNPDRDRLTLSTNIVNEEGHFAYSGGYKSSSNIGGGGGGAGQHGAIGSTTSPGGDGKQYDIRTGSVEWYAGGGGGGARTGVDVPGGQGGGGYGASTSGGGPEPGGPGTANTGGGGGGSVHNGGNNIAGNGGSGILVIRY